MNSLSTMLLAEAANPVSHMVNKPFVTIDGWWVWSAHVGNLVLAGIIVVLLGRWAASRIDVGPESEGSARYLTKNPLAHFIEVTCVYLRESTVRPMLGERTDRFMPFLWTLFFFILVNNLLGLVPIVDTMYALIPSLAASHRAPVGQTATQNVFVTGGLALVSFLVINIEGMRRMGIRRYFSHMTGGAPLGVAWLVAGIEFMGIFTKPFALAVRLFANMTAGHVLVATLFMFVGMSLAKSLAVGVPVSAVSIGAAIAIYFLEVFIAFIQAFVFMFLTAVFISLLDVHEEGHEPVAA